MRGKVKGCSYCAKYTRITPAYAGKSQHSERDSRKSEDHPRLCGEKALTVSTMLFQIGSPPPMRGKGSNGAGGVKMERITPAYAGKSLVCVSSNNA